MNLNDIFNCIRKNGKRKNVIKKIFSLFFILIMLFEVIYLYNSNLTHNQREPLNNYKEMDNLELDNPNIAAGIELLQDPFTKNFSDIGEFLVTKYNTKFDTNLSFYYRYGDFEGNRTTDYRVFPMDFMLMYKSLLRSIGSPEFLYTLYHALSYTQAYYEGNVSNYEYGYLRSINGSNGEIIDDNRYLIDNLLPIFYIIENKIHTSTLSIISKSEVQKAFKLINSSQFYDANYTGFFTYNKSYTKSTESNLYAILANFLIHRTEELDNGLRAQAYERANETMITLIDKMWDDDRLGFYYQATDQWNSGGPGNQYKYLHVNALGIIAMLEYWFATGMNETFYIENATNLYHKLNDYLWNSTGAYEYSTGSPVWQTSTDLDDRRIDLEANAIMMQAILKLYEATGNISYYYKALELFDFFEKKLYDPNVHGYNQSVGSVISNDKNLYKNLRLCEAYLHAYDIYNSTVLTSVLNTTGVPNLVINQDTLMILSNYTLEKTTKYYNTYTSSYQDFTVKHNITDANITYIFRYPNQTIYKTIEDHIEANATTGWAPARTIITCEEDENNNLNGTYFNITTPSERYYVWINMSSSGGPDPGFIDRIPIQINTIDTNDTDAEVATEIRNALNTFNGGSIFTAQVSNLVNVSVVNKEDGMLQEHIIDGSAPYATNFTFTLITPGENRTINEHILIYPIPEDLPLSITFKEYQTVGASYTVQIYVNTTNFGFAYAQQKFNVISGIENKSIVMDNIYKTRGLYQGQTMNITLPIKNNRKENITLTVNLEGDGIVNDSKVYNFTAYEYLSEEILVEFNITALFDATPGITFLHFTFKNGSVIYLEVYKPLLIASALDYSNLMYNKEVVLSDQIQVSLNLINFLPNNSQSFNLSFSGAYIQNKVNEITLAKGEIRTVSYILSVLDTNLESIEVEMTISKGAKDFFTDKLTIDIIQRLEILSVSFPEKVSQGELAYLIILIRNNQEEKEKISLFINNEEVELDINELSPGENRIEKEILVSINPYELGKKSYEIVLKDGSNDNIVSYYYEIELELSVFNLVVFYFMPIIIPIGIFLKFKNKDIKSKLLRK